MNTHNIHFYGELGNLSLNYHKISSISVSLSEFSKVLLACNHF